MQYTEASFELLEEVDLVIFLLISSALRLLCYQMKQI